MELAYYVWILLNLLAAVGHGMLSGFALADVTEWKHLFGLFSLMSLLGLYSVRTLLQVGLRPINKANTLAEFMENLLVHLLCINILCALQATLVQVVGYLALRRDAYWSYRYHLTIAQLCKVRRQIGYVPTSLFDEEIRKTNAAAAAAAINEKKRGRSKSPRRRAPVIGPAPHEETDPTLAAVKRVLLRLGLNN